MINPGKSILLLVIAGVFICCSSMFFSSVKAQENSVISVDKTIVSETANDDSVKVGLIASPILPVFPSGQQS